MPQPGLEAADGLPPGRVDVPPPGVTHHAMPLTAADAITRLLTEA